MSNRKLINVIVVMVALMSVTACGVFKKGAKKDKTKKAGSTVTIITSKDSVKPVAVTVNPDMDKQLAETYAPVWKKEIPFNTFSGKAKWHYEGKGQNYDFTANIRIKKDEVVWVMVSALGGMVQVARMYATPDSFAMINYLEKSYLSMGINEVNKVLPFPVDFTMLQNLFIGNALRTDGEVADAKNAGDIATLIVKKDRLNQDVAINKSTNTLSLLRVYLDNENSEAVVKYNNYKDRDGRNFPHDRMINVSNAGEQHLLEMNFTDAKFDQAVDMPFSVPSNYSKN